MHADPEITPLTDSHDDCQFCKEHAITRRCSAFVIYYAGLLRVEEVFVHPDIFEEPSRRSKDVLKRLADFAEFVFNIGSGDAAYLLRFNVIWEDLFDDDGDLQWHLGDMAIEDAPVDMFRAWAERTSEFVLPENRALFG